MPEETKLEVERELGEIRKEVIESRNLVIKTDNLLKNLHAELKAVGKRQEEFQKKQFFSSAVAYVLFALMAVGGAVALTSAKTSTASNERERLEKQVAELMSDAEKLKSEAKGQLTASQGASEVYRLMTSLPGDERLKGIDALVKLDQTKLTPLERQALNDRAALLRKEIGEVAFERGKTAFRRNDMNGAVNELRRFLAMNPEREQALDASFFLGTAYSQLRQPEKAIPLLSNFVTNDRKSKSREYAMLMLAQAYEQVGQYEKSAETARDALGTYPNGEFSTQIKGRLSAAKRVLTGGSATA